MNKHVRKVRRKEGSRHAMPVLARRLLRDVWPCETSVDVWPCERSVARPHCLREFFQLTCRKKKVKDKRRYNNQTKGSEDEQAK